jgi:UDP-N-acetylmuramoylalanine--D-glutamate ligase
MQRDFFQNKRVAVIGAARTGVAVARALIPLGAAVHVFDAKSEEALGGTAALLRTLGAGVSLGAEDGAALLEADIVVPSPGVWKTNPVLVSARERGQTVWSEPEVAYRISQAPILGITGTNGKTTTTALLGAMLSDAGRDARVGGNIAPGRPLIEIASDAPANALLVGEISSFQLEWIAEFRPLIGILTNLSSDHLNRHGSMQEYAAMKARLFENQTQNEHAIVKADDAAALAIGRAGRGTLWTWSRRGPVARGAFLRDSEIVFRDGQGETRLASASDVLIPGAHNLENAMAAAIAGKILGLSADNILHTLTRFRGVEHRMEPVATIRGARYVNNSMCTNPEALVSSLEAYAEPVIAIVGGVNKALDYRGVADALGSRCKAVLTIGEMAPEFARMAREAGTPNVAECGTLEAAVAAAAALARSGDVVILAPGCASMDQFRDFEDRGAQFKDLVRRLGD